MLSVSYRVVAAGYSYVALLACIYEFLAMAKNITRSTRNRSSTEQFYWFYAKQKADKRQEKCKYQRGKMMDKTTAVVARHRRPH